MPWSRVLGALLVFGVGLVGCEDEQASDPVFRGPPCSAPAFAEAAAAIRELPPEAVGSRATLAFDALRLHCEFLPMRAERTIAVTQQLPLHRTRELASLSWERADPRRSAIDDRGSPEYNALVRELGWSARVEQVFRHVDASKVAVGADLVLEDSGVGLEDRKTVAWAAFAGLGPAWDVWPEVRLARVEGMGTPMWIWGEPDLLHVSTDAWARGALALPSSLWFRSTDDWKPLTVSTTEPLAFEERDGRIVLVDEDVPAARLETFLRALRSCTDDRASDRSDGSGGSDGSGRLNRRGEVDCDHLGWFAVVSEYFGADYPIITYLPIAVADRPARCAQVAGCGFLLPTPDSGRERWYPVDAFVRLHGDLVEIQTRDAMVWQELDEWRKRGDLPAVNAEQPVVMIIADPDVRWGEIARAHTALRGPDCSLWAPYGPECRSSHVGLWVSD